MENLDDLMRKKFDSDDPTGRFEFREEFWEQARVMIEADEAQRKKRKRRVFWWWFLFAGLAIACWQLAEWSSTRENTAEQHRQPGGADANGIVHDKNRPAVQHNADATPDSLSTKELPSDVSTNNNHETRQAATSRNEHNTPENQKQTGTKNVQPVIPDSRRSDVGQHNATPVAPPDEKDRRQKAGKGDRKLPVTAPQVSAPTAGDRKDDSLAESVGTGSKQDNENTAPGTSSASSDSIGASAQTTTSVAPLGLLPTLAGLLEPIVRSPDMPQAATATALIQPARDPKWRMGLEIAGSAGQASLDGKRFGASAGLVFQRRLTPSLALSTGLRWRYLAGAWAEDTMPTESKQLRYSFGFVRDDWSLRSRGQHLLEVPLALRWQRKRLALEAGVTAGWLAGVRGEVVRRHSESLQSGISIERSATWLNTTPFHRFVPGVFAGAAWKATRRMDITVQGNWRPGKVGNVLNPDAPPPPSNLTRLDVGLRWYF